MSIFFISHEFMGYLGMFVNLFPVFVLACWLTFFV